MTPSAIPTGQPSTWHEATARAAQVLQISERTLYRKLREYGIS